MAMPDSALALDCGSAPATAAIKALVDEHLLSQERDDSNDRRESEKQPSQAAYDWEPACTPEGGNSCKKTGNAQSEACLRSALPSELVLAGRSARDPCAEESVIEKVQASRDEGKKKEPTRYAERVDDGWHGWVARPNYI